MNGIVDDHLYRIGIKNWQFDDGCLLAISHRVE